MSRLTAQDVQAQISHDYDQYYAARYKGPELPANSLELFRDAVMYVIPKNYNLHTAAIRKILATPLGDLTHGEVGIVVNVVTDVPFNVRYQNIEEALEAHGELEKIMIEYNGKDRQFQERCQAKQRRLMAMVPTESEIVPFR